MSTIFFATGIGLAIGTSVARISGAEIDPVSYIEPIILLLGAIYFAIKEEE